MECFKETIVDTAARPYAEGASAGVVCARDGACPP